MKVAGGDAMVVWLWYSAFYYNNTLRCVSIESRFKMWLLHMKGLLVWDECLLVLLINWGVFWCCEMHDLLWVFCTATTLDLLLFVLQTDLAPPLLEMSCCMPQRLTFILLFCVSMTTNVTIHVCVSTCQIQAHDLVAGHAICLQRLSGNCRGEKRTLCS